ncbi:uncharacterized protein B0H18DRAFT_958073 [Fomitopsis serialis]|uniref:uncharacterized protein n=1 Tax=Fomitopsis serialis TaxID=139415 RepID=UPI0020087400|nr:uncharacterized protein B0H18DRAFT_958073 [Neoantrodia serialis]KAH9918051.1 hypothetical protein B0H18DRAFT_958073 [Neoantrodia serialis]
MSQAVVRFPPPPPTSNNLSSKQRTQLMRSSKKLGQVLGSTPHVLDWASSSGIGESSPRHTLLGGTMHMSTINPTTSSSTRGEQAWRTPYDPLHRPPLLKLSPPSRSGHSERRRSTYSDCDTEASVPDSPTAPSFAIPSEAAIRRAKMQRLTRKLGDGVPPELVFPSAARLEPDSEAEDDSPLLETPAADKKLPFSQVLPTIPERRPTTASSQSHDEVIAQPVQGPRKAGDRRSYRDAVYVIDSPDEHGLDDGWGVVCIGDPTKYKKADRHTEPSSKREKAGDVVCLGVAASAGPFGEGRSGRWVKGDVAFDRIAAPGWHGGGW